MIKVGIIGATGYAGNELVRLLLGHKDAEIVWLGSRSYIDQNYSDVYRNMFKLVDAKCMDDNMEQLANEVDVIFTATPQGLCASLVNDEILSKTKIIDLSADFRLKDVNVYEQWYKLEHKAPQYIDEAVYGLCEINRGKVSRDTRIIANPGCYTTTSILTLYPMVKEGIINPDTIIIDAKSGTSGAGRGAKVANLFCEVNESMKAYGVGTHRHTPEIEEQLGYACGRDDLKLIFTPHLVPMNRGILVTAYANLAKDVTYEDVKAAYDKYCLTCCTLNKIIYSSHHNHTACTRFNLIADIHKVTSLNPACLRIYVLVKQPYKVFICIMLLISTAYHLICDPILQISVCSHQYSPVHRNKMWCENKLNLLTCRIRKLLFNLRCMSVCPDTVSLNALINLTVQIGYLCASSRA